MATAAVVNEVDQERALSSMILHTSADIAAFQGSQKAKQELFDSYMVSLANAGGINMDGKTFYDPAARSAPEVENLAGALGTKATPHRNSISVYPFARQSGGASGTILYTDANTNEPMLLLVRRKKDADRWGYPAGYMDIMPEGGKILAGRVDEAARDKLEEQTVGKRLESAAPQVPNAQAGAREQEVVLPDQAAMRKVLDVEYREQLSARGWSEAQRLMQDSDYIREILKKNGLAIPVEAGVDVTSKENFLRETKEETGLDVSSFANARTRPIRPGEVSLNYSSGNQRNYTSCPHYLTDLGTLASPPQVAPVTGDVMEAAWIPVRNIRRGADGNYNVITADGKTAMPLSAYAVPVIEESLNAWLSGRMADTSGNRFTGPANLKAELESRGGKARISKAGGALQASAAAIHADKLGENNMLPELMGPDGVRRMQDYLTVATALSAQPESLSFVERVKTLVTGQPYRA
jgi:ADP-ribose pyrophosphatase YjhB (NUDIX family)